MFWLILAVAFWGVVHSLMASLKFKEFLRRVLGNGGMKFYRLFYNIFSVLSIAPVFYLMIALPDRAFYQIPAPWSYLFLLGSGISVLLLFVAVLQTDVLSFIGLRQLFEDAQPSPLVTNGFYRMIRHPLYTFGLLALWLSSSVSMNAFVVYIGLTLYILVGIYFEERKLLREFGQAYADYQAVTPMLIPGLKFGGNK
ncbi:MAG: isoprenylcysteine carboxylmethyltransferase family protein [Chloroflexota bacterium]